jgi:hypothetical protein
LEPYSVWHNGSGTINENLERTIKFHENSNFISIITFDLQHKMCCNFLSTCKISHLTIHAQKTKSNFASFRHLPHIDFRNSNKLNFKRLYLGNHTFDIQDMHIPMISKSTPFICDILHFNQCPESKLHISPLEISITFSRKFPKTPRKAHVLGLEKTLQLSIYYREINWANALGIKLLVLVNLHSRFLTVRIMKETSAPSVCDQLEDICAGLGYPEGIKADNGPPFDSVFLKDWCAKRDIQLFHSTPYAPC